MAVGLPARLPSGAQTPSRRGQAGLGQAIKQGGVARFNLPLACHAWTPGRAGHSHLSKHAPDVWTRAEQTRIGGASDDEREVGLVGGRV